MLVEVNREKILAAALVFAFSTAHAAQDPEAVFNRSCTMCHSGQLPMAPKKGDKVAWKQRLEQGNDVLVKHVTEGFNAMPARGLCMNCTAEDYKAVIDWMSK
ncbi:cytochrome c5 family protein [Pseudomonas lactis]|uniref:c-type cytochrome n=1 Tax=Pseudomonas lactis TaxID=1615674 RepID=UPI00396A0596|nr:cytochrome c5 family protein [Pseudomonas lactis]